MHDTRIERVDDIVRQMGSQVISCREIVGRGCVNHVFVVTTPRDKWVVRFHRDPLDSDDYSKEAWCLEKAASAKIPVPCVIDVGVSDGVSFIVQSFVSGVHADELRSPDLWRSLGRYARNISEISLDDSAPDSLFPRFGRNLVDNWHRHIAYNLGELTEDDPLIGYGAYSPPMQKVLRSAFAELESRVDRFGLTHGDLVPKNVLLSPDGTPVVLDWGSAITGPAPFADYNRLWADPAEEGFRPEDLTAFAAGYGIPVEFVIDTMRDLQLLDRIDVVRWAVDHRPDRIPELVAKARGYTERLQGSLGKSVARSFAFHFSRSPSSDSTYNSVSS